MKKVASIFESDNDLNLKATELTLGLPGRDDESVDQQQSSPSAKNNKRSSPEMDEFGQNATEDREFGTRPSKGQEVGWPPVRAHRKNALQQKKGNECDGDGGCGNLYVKVSMDGAPYLRKIDLKFYNNYFDLLKALEDMFKCTAGKEGSEYVPTYEDKDGDWMLVGDVPWHMFATCCKRMRIMNGSAYL